MPETELDKEELYNLSDLDVTVGIVSRGAVSAFAEKGVNFFLLKSEDGMTEPIVIEESPDLPDASPSLWSKITQTIKAEIAKAIGKPPMDDEAEEEAVVEEELEDEEDTEKGRVSSGGGKPKKQDGPKGKDKMSKEQTEVTPQTDAQEVIATVQKAHIEAILKSMQEQHAQQLEAVTKAIEEKYEAKITGLTEKVEKAETDRAQAEEARQEREFIEKAMTFRTLSVGHTDLGKLLHKAHKALDGEDYAQIEAILKAADNQLGAAGIFGEFGTARTPEEVTLEDKVQKAATEGVSYADALLSLSEDEQNQLLKSMRGGK
jgi:hypothetical protein